MSVGMTGRYRAAGFSCSGLLCGHTTRYADGMTTKRNYISVSPDQLASAGSYISHEWADYGYRIEGIETRTSAVSIFRVVCTGDGSRFTVLVDRWSNCRYLDTHNGDDGLDELVREMHANATKP